MSSSATAPGLGVRRCSWLASSALTAAVLPFFVGVASAQQSASPDLQIREVTVRAPQQPAQRPAARPATQQRRTTRAPTPPPAPVSTPTQAPIVVEATVGPGLITPNAADDPLV